MSTPLVLTCGTGRLVREDKIFTYLNNGIVYFVIYEERYPLMKRTVDVL